MSPLLTTGDVLTVLFLVIGGLGFVGSLLAAIADYPWHTPRHDVADDLTTLLPSRTTARPAGEPTGGVRAGHPHAATTPIAVPATEPITPRPYVMPDTVPVLVVDSPPSMRGKLPTPDLGVPIVRRWSCGLCHDGDEVIGESCIWCGHPAAVRA